MPEHSFQPPLVHSTLSAVELQAWAEQMLPRPRTLQELPLILVPPSLLNSPEPWGQIPAAIQSSVQAWLEAAYSDDERLRIERRLIPHTPIYIPDTPAGREVFQLAKAIADIPLNAPIVPKNQNQGYWLKTLHYYWQARGIALAQQLNGVILDPLGDNGVLKDRLSDKNLEHLRLKRALDAACFHLLTQGENHIKRWAEKPQIGYPFETSFELFLELLREEFLVTWQLGPCNQEKAPSKAKQRDNVAVRVRLLKQSPWLPETGNRLPYNTTEQEYLQYLRQAGWSGYWLLALRSYRYDPSIEPNWESYAQVMSQGKELAVDTLDWLHNEPFHRPRSNTHRGVQGSLDLLGYIHWIWD